MRSGQLRRPIGPPPPDICNPLDRLARPVVRPPVLPAFPPPFPLGMVRPTALADKVAMNFAPPPRPNQSDRCSSERTMKESSDAVVGHQENVVVPECGGAPPKLNEEDGELSDSEEGECDSDTEEGELEVDGMRPRPKERKGNIIPLVRRSPDAVQRRLEKIAAKDGKEPSYRDRGFRERESTGDKEESRRNGSMPPRDSGRSSRPDYNRRGDSSRNVRPGDMPSLISLPPMPQINSSAKGKIPDFPPLSFAAHMPPMVPPAWPAPPPIMPGRFPDKADARFEDPKMRKSFEEYHRAWESYYSDMREKGSGGGRSSKGAEPGSRGPEMKNFSPGPPPPFPPMPPMMPGVAGMPFPGGGAGGPAGGGPKESAWERGLKVSKRIREELRRNEKSDEESDDSNPNSKLQSKVVMKEPSPARARSLKSSRHSVERGRRGSPAELPPPRLTPERYRGAYERSREERVAHDAAWSDPWMRGPSSPGSKERKRAHHSPSSSSSGSSSGDSSPRRSSFSDLRRTLEAANKRRLVKKQAAKLKKLREKLTPEEYKTLMRGRKRGKKSSGAGRKDESSDSDSDSSSSSSDDSRKGPGSPESISSPDLSMKDKKKKREVLMKQLQMVEKQLEKKKKDERKRRS